MDRMNHEKRRTPESPECFHSYPGLKKKNGYTKSEKVTYNLKHALLFIYNFHMKPWKI